MKTEPKFPIGTRVVIEPTILDVDNDLRVGTVLAKTSKGECVVEWDKSANSESWAGTHRPINLTREQDAAATVAKLKRTYTCANQEITQKLNQAAKLIIEAVAVANKHGADLTDFDGATDKVREAVSHNCIF